MESRFSNDGWAQSDLNRRPPGYQPGAPAKLSYGPEFFGTVGGVLRFLLIVEGPPSVRFESPESASTPPPVCRSGIRTERPDESLRTGVDTRRAGPDRAESLRVRAKVQSEATATEAAAQFHSLPPLDATEPGATTIFRAEWKADPRYVHEQGRFIVRDGRNWERDTTKLTRRPRFESAHTASGCPSSRWSASWGIRSRPPGRGTTVTLP